ncbi:hypothetical protein K2Z83_05220 [Oscillochloris sp. ZM17-4]|uniref:hypothetical protein n=1 Tax=Oscillochloris sp. ZM17-4 TaxID=2866714 RepID=UPI001C733F27|nr:hypothetical protein [Oscillochloris sp. ZM17-4]MBX0327083.1 hypothetical protein [Oscillochloris sp. ZM17-4]
MSLAKLITAELRRLGADAAALAAIPADEAGLRTVELGGADGTPSARVTFFDADRYSVSLRMLTVAGRELPPPGDEPGAADARLAALASGVIAGLSYLEEPLAVVERDAADAQAQIRSHPPLREDELLSYWDVALTSGARPSASIARYCWEPGLPERQPLPYPATYALVARIADSLVAALDI